MGHGPPYSAPMVLVAFKVVQCLLSAANKVAGVIMLKTTKFEGFPILLMLWYLDVAGTRVLLPLCLDYRNPSGMCSTCVIDKKPRLRRIVSSLY